MRHLVLGAALGAVALAGPVASAEDFTIVSTVTTGKGAPTTATTYITADRVRSSDGQTDTIMHNDGRMVVIDHKKKEYWETTADEMRATFQQLEAQMAGNPMMEKMLGGAIGAVDVTKGTSGRTIAGYKTDHYVLSMGENFRWEIWAAPDLKVPASYFDARKAPFAATGPFGKRFEKVFDEMKEINGFPLAISMSSKMMMMKQEQLTEATEVRKGAVPASAFEVPAGYKKKKSPFQK